jgi:hypothetical protein
MYPLRTIRRILNVTNRDPNDDSSAWAVKGVASDWDVPWLGVDCAILSRGTSNRITSFVIEPWVLKLEDLNKFAATTDVCDFLP